MSAAQLLREVARQGVELVGDGDRLRARARPGVLTAELRARLAEHKAELLALLRRRLTEPDTWDQARADQVLAAVTARLERALAPGGEADSPARRNVLAVYRGLAADYHHKRDPLLWEALEAVENLLARWKDVGKGESSYASETDRWWPSW